jgi:hypothetical protein
MNLHIVPDNTFINKFYDNLNDLNLLGVNKIIVRSNDSKLKSIRHNIPFAPLYSVQFASLVGDTAQYEKVFIHYFTPLMYRWVAWHKFKELNWMIWGGDLYNLPSLDNVCYEPLTFQQYVKQNLSIKTLLYRLKVFVTNSPFKRKAYSKVKNILTWMPSEYQFAIEHLPVEATHKFFFYENQLPYEKLDSIVVSVKANERQALIIGNSGSPENNHLDVVRFLEENSVSADLLIPVSYGDARYIAFLKKKLTYNLGKIEFIERYMPFEEYLNFLGQADALVMNTIRPQGYGNILMMMYIGKPVFFNEKNISLPDLSKAGLQWFPVKSLRSHSKQNASNKEAVIKLLSHDRLLKEYQLLFN